MSPISSSHIKSVNDQISDGFRSCPTRYRCGIRPTNRFLRSVGTLLFGTDLRIGYKSVGLNRGRFGFEIWGFEVGRSVLIFSIPAMRSVVSLMISGYSTFIIYEYNKKIDIINRGFLLWYHIVTWNLFISWFWNSAPSHSLIVFLGILSVQQK